MPYLLHSYHVEIFYKINFSIIEKKPTRPMNMGFSSFGTLLALRALSGIKLLKRSAKLAVKLGRKAKGLAEIA